MKNYRGIFHVHSNYSCDGKLPIRDIVRICKNGRINFLILTEHIFDRNKWEFTTKDKIKEFINTCNLISNSNFYVIPGMEITCCNNKIHIIAVGLKDYFEIKNLSKPKEILLQIKKNNCLAILAHPFKYRAIDILKQDELGLFDGFELWNRKEDGRLAPPIKNYYYSKAILRKYKNMYCYLGLDLHSYKQFSKLQIVINSHIKDKESILVALREGKFFCKSRFFTFDNKGKSTNDIILFLIRIIYNISHKLKPIINRTKTRVEGVTKSGN